MRKGAVLAAALALVSVAVAAPDFDGTARRLTASNPTREGKVLAILAFCRDSIREVPTSFR